MPYVQLEVNGQLQMLEPTGRICLGRALDNHVILDQSDVSSWHAELRPDVTGWEVRDVGSANGVLLDGQRLTRPQLVDVGNILELGSALIRVVDLGTPIKRHKTEVNSRNQVRALKLIKQGGGFKVLVQLPHHADWVETPNIFPLAARLLWMLLQQPTRTINIYDERDLFERAVRQNSDARLYTNRTRLRVWWRKLLVDEKLDLPPDPLETTPNTLSLAIPIAVDGVELPEGNPVSL